MSRKRIKVKSTYCTQCGSEAGLLLVTLPRDRFLRPRIQREIDKLNDLQAKVEQGVVTPDFMKKALWEDRQSRTVRLCPKHIKPLWGKHQSTKVADWWQI